MASLNAPLFSAAFDVTPLQAILTEIDRRVCSLESQCGTLANENDALRQAIAVATERAEVSENQYAALYDVVTTIDRKFNAMETSFISRDEVAARVMAVAERISAVNTRCDELSEKKMDADSILLATRVREIAQEMTMRHISLRDKDQRDWFATQLTETESRITEASYRSLRDSRGQIERLIDAQRSRSEELGHSLMANTREIDAAVQLVTRLTKALTAKLEAHETDLDVVESHCQEDVDALRSVVKGLFSAFGVDSTQIMDATDETDMHDEPGDALRACVRECTRLQRQHDRAQLWRAVKQVQSGTPVAGSMHDPQGKLDLSPIELRRDERLRNIQLRKERREAARGASHDATMRIPVSRAGHILLNAPLMLEAKESTMELVRQLLDVLQKETAADFGSQVQTLQRELRSKIGTQRAVELIEQHARATLQGETKELMSLVSGIQGAMMHRDDILAALATKADIRALQNKADSATLAASVVALENKISEARDSVSEGLTKLIGIKVRELSAAKLDRRDPTYLSMINVVQRGDAFQTPSLNMADGRCASCGTIPGHPPSTRGTEEPTRGTKCNLDELQAAQDASLQAAQDQTHELQMSHKTSSTSRPSSAARAPTDWIQLLDSKFKGRMIVPAPPHSARQ